MDTAARPPVAPLTGRLPRLAPALAGWSRLLHDQRLSPLLQRGGNSIEVRAAAGGPAGDRFTLELACDGLPAGIEISRLDHPALAMASAPTTRVPLRRLAALALFSAPSAWLEQLGMGEWIAQGLHAQSEPAPLADDAAASPWVDVYAGARCLATLRITHAPDAFRAALHTSLRRARVAAARRATWAVSGRVQLHLQRHRRSLLGSLGCGDVLLLAPCTAATRPWPVSVCWGLRGGRSLRARAAIDDRFVTIEGTPKMQEEKSKPDLNEADDAPPDALGDMDIAVHFELDTVAMPLGDLEAIGPGYVIELATPLSAANVRLVACGQVIGHAELVVVGEQLGARITRMVAP